MATVAPEGTSPRLDSTPEDYASSPVSSSAPVGDQQQPLEQTSHPQGGPRRTSFNFLRRSKSREGQPNVGHRSVSGAKMGRKQKARAQEELLRQQREAALLPQKPPQLPSPPPLPTINTFGGENARPDSVAIISNQVNSYYARPAKQPPTDRRMHPTPKPPTVPAPPVSGSSPYNSSSDFDPYARTESMTHRGRYSYASSAVSTLNSPRRMRRRKDPTPFNILVVGAKNSGKTSFINFLRKALALPPNKHPQTAPPPKTNLPPNSPFTSEFLESEIDNERIGVTLWDSQGLQKNIVDLQLREMSAFLESKFEETFAEEQKVVRAPGVLDTHIHCVFLILDPARLDSNIAESHTTSSSMDFGMPSRIIGGLDEDLDIQVLRTLRGKTTVIPVISKADTVTTAHMTYLKKTVWDSLKQAKLDPLEALALDTDEEDGDILDERDEDTFLHSSSDTDDMIDKLVDRSSSEAPRSRTSSNSTSPPQSPDGAPKRPIDGHKRRASAMSATIASAEQASSEVPYLPLSIISPDLYEPDVVGRKFPWGFADPYNADHCDFVRLKESVFSEWRGELRQASRERWYEGWRTSRLKQRIDTPSRRGTAGDLGGKKKFSLSPVTNNIRSLSAGSVPENQKAQYKGF